MLKHKITVIIFYKYTYPAAVGQDCCCDIVSFMFLLSGMRLHGYIPLASVRDVSECQRRRRCLVRNWSVVLHS